MPITRREILIAGSLALLAPRLGHTVEPDWVALAKGEDIAPPVIPLNLSYFKDKPSLNQGVIVRYEEMGSQRPLPAEESLGNLIINAAPKNCTPIEVALYYWAIGQGTHGEARKPYATAWPERWNPVIVKFFEATDLQPSGDTTAWCAAMMNYCLLRAAVDKSLPANASPHTKKAGALSFRKWGKTTTNPIPGDIVVFQNVKPGSEGHGHVGFFLADQGDRVLVLGGNQFEGTPRRHTISRKSLPKDGPVLKVIAYRTEEQLHV